MVTESAKPGLIVSTLSQCNVPLDDLIACCGWPVLLSANARRLQQELSLQARACVLFWLEDPRQTKPTAKLVAWLRDSEPRPYRIAIAHRLSEGAETLFRAAGVHCYFSSSGDIAEIVEKSLWPLLHSAGIVDADIASPLGPVSLNRAPINRGTLRKVARPP